MKNLLLGLVLLISSMAFSQKPIIDSIQVFKTLPSEKVEDLQVATLYNGDTFYQDLTKISDETGLNQFIVKFFYKEEENGPQKTYVTSLKRKK